MLLSYNWLTELVDLPVGSSELADVLTWLGLEVEAVTEFKPCLGKTVIGQVLECDPVEGSDHLFITQTDVGGEVYPIVCGAPNVRKGMKSAVMLPGSITAQGMKIKKSKLRGHESRGMLASDMELGLAVESPGIIEGEESWKAGEDAARYLNLSDTVYDAEVTPNRPDFLSHVGVARDLAAKFRVPWQYPKHELTESDEPAESFVQVRIDAPNACPRYAARVVRGITIKPSPYEMGLRLTRCGARPISNIVDITNYLMMEYGQPLHAFDARFILDRSIIVRLAEEGEVFITLDDEERKLTAQDLLIADRGGGIAIAGVMGGLNSEIRDTTTDVIIECAYFDPVHIRRTSKQLGLSTDSSKRFERGLDPNGVPRVIDATAGLMQKLGGGTIMKRMVDVYPKEIKPPAVSFRPKRAVSLIGLDIPSDEMKDSLSRLGCAVEEGKESWAVTVPTHRPDLEREVDLIEEVIRIHGYDSVPTAESSRVVLSGSDDEMSVFRRAVEDVLVGEGFLQTISLSMSNPDERRDPPGLPGGVAIGNPVTDDMRYLQGSVLGQLLRAAAANYRRGDRNLRLFETTRVFHEGEAGDPRTWERWVVAGLLTGQSYPQSWAHDTKPFDFHDLKGVLVALCTRLSIDNPQIYYYDTTEDGGQSAELKSGTVTCGKLGVWPAALMANRDIDASVGWFELDLASLSSCRSRELRYRTLPRFPVSRRDIAVLVDADCRAGDLQETIRTSGGEHLVSVQTFDVFQGKKLGANKKSIAFHVEFSHDDRSLEAGEVDEWMKSIVTELERKHSAQLR